MLVQVEFNTVCEILYEVKAKVKIKALGKRKAKVENKKLGESGSQGMTCGRMVAVEVDRLGDKLSMVKTKALVETIAYRVNEVDGHTLRYLITAVDAEMLVYELDKKLPVVEEENVGNMLAEVKSKAVLETLPAKEKKLRSTHLATHGPS